MATPRARPSHPAGLTLAEMLVTVAVLALAASIAVPSASPAASFAADADAGEVVRAVRFAQREAVRTGAWHAARFNLATQSLEVYRLATNGEQVVLHPVEKTRYELRFGANSRLATVEFKYRTRPMTNFISFRPDGVPARFNAAAPAGDLLELDGKVVLAQGSVQRSVSVARVTGRVAF